MSTLLGRKSFRCEVLRKRNYWVDQETGVKESVVSYGRRVLWARDYIPGSRLDLEYRAVLSYQPPDKISSK